jgi:hypothetical protein
MKYRKPQIVFTREALMIQGTHLKFLTLLFDSILIDVVSIIAYEADE